MSRQAGQYQRRNGHMAGSLTPEAGRSRGGGCNRGLCAEKWGTLFPQLFPSSPSSPCLETLVTSLVAQSLRVEVSPSKREQSQSTPSPSVLPPARRFPALFPPFPFPFAFPSTGCRDCYPCPSSSHTSGRFFEHPGQEPRGRGCPGSRGWGITRLSEGMEQGRTHRYTRAQGGLGKHQPGVSERGAGTGAASSSCPAPGTMKHSGAGGARAAPRPGTELASSSPSPPPPFRCRFSFAMNGWSKEPLSRAAESFLHFKKKTTKKKRQKNKTTKKKKTRKKK